MSSKGRSKVEFEMVKKLFLQTRPCVRLCQAENSDVEEEYLEQWDGPAYFEKVGFLELLENGLWEDAKKAFVGRATSWNLSGVAVVWVGRQLIEYVYNRRWIGLLELEDPGTYRWAQHNMST